MTITIKYYLCVGNFCSEGAKIIVYMCNKRKKKNNGSNLKGNLFARTDPICPEEQTKINPQ